MVRSFIRSWSALYDMLGFHEADDPEAARSIIVTSIAQRNANLLLDSSNSYVYILLNTYFTSDYVRNELEVVHRLGGVLPSSFKQADPIGCMMRRMNCTVKYATTTYSTGSKRFVACATIQPGVSTVLAIPHMMSWLTLDGTSIGIGERLGAPTVAVVIMPLFRNRPMNLLYSFDLTEVGYSLSRSSAMRGIGLP